MVSIVVDTRYQQYPFLVDASKYVEVAHSQLSVSTVPCFSRAHMLHTRQGENAFFMCKIFE